MKRVATLCAVGLVALGLVVPLAAIADEAKDAAGHQHKHAHDHGNPDKHTDRLTHAIAVLHPTQGNSTRGVVRFVESEKTVRITAEIEGLTANAAHAIHIHEFGDCSAADASSAGGHYNPEGHPHAGPAESKRHAGDLGNLQANAEGKATLELTVDNVTIAGKRNPVLGRAVIVHAKADDLKTQPTGDAGGRIACGIIGVANTQK